MVAQFVALFALQKEGPGFDSQSFYMEYTSSFQDPGFLGQSKTYLS